jgi:hypothetical protein
MDRAFTWATSPRSTIGCVQNYFCTYGAFDANRAPILRQDLHYLRKDWAFTWASSPLSTIEFPHDPRHLGVPSGASKMISMPMVCSTQIVHLSYFKISTISKRTELSLEPRHLGVPLGASKMFPKTMVCLSQTVQSCTDTKTVSKWKEVRFHMTHVT